MDSISRIESWGLNLTRQLNDLDTTLPNNERRPISIMIPLFDATIGEKLNKELSDIQSKLLAASKPEISRHSIPDDVKMFVWNRDGGRCVKCGSHVNLEFDHIIPIAKGGSNTARNLQLLCEKCNRSKGAEIS